MRLGVLALAAPIGSLEETLRGIAARLLHGLGSPGSDPR
jgi:hypothetical protein